MDTKDYFNEDLIFFTEEVDRTILLGNLSDQLYKKGFVKESFKHAVLAREDKFPTGLSTENIGVALPHTDSDHVLVPFIAVGVLASPVKFHLMGSTDLEVEVQIIFMLGVKDPSRQVDVLQDLIELIHDDEMSQEIINATSEYNIAALLKKFTKSAS